MPAAAFANAQRFHDGGLPGLKSNEVPTILERGEEVLTADDPRHINNVGAGGGGQPVVLQPQLTFDTVDAVQNALARPEGTQVMMGFFRANKGAIKATLGS